MTIAINEEEEKEEEEEEESYDVHVSCFGVPALSLISTRTHTHTLPVHGDLFLMHCIVMWFLPTYAGKKNAFYSFFSSSSLRGVGMAEGDVTKNERAI